MSQEKIRFLSVGNIGISALNTFINSYLALYLLSYNTNIWVVILLCSSGFILGIFLQPLSGRISDIIKNRTEDRTLMFISSGIGTCVLLELMARAEVQYKAFYVIGFFSLFHIYQMPLAACIPDATADEHIEKASSYWTSMGMAGSFIVPPLVVFIWNFNKELLLDALSYIVLSSILITAFFTNSRKSDKSKRIKSDMRSLIRTGLWKKLYKLYIIKICWWMAAGFIIPFFPLYMAQKLGINITSMSLTIEAMLIMSMIFSIVLVKFMRVYNKKFILIAGMVYLLIYSIVFVINRNPYVIITLMVLYSIPYSILITVPLSIVYKLMPGEIRGTILGIDNIFLNLPQAMSIGMAGIIYVIFGINYVYIISAIFSMVTIILLVQYNTNRNSDIS